MTNAHETPPPPPSLDDLEPMPYIWRGEEPEAAHWEAMALERVTELASAGVGHVAASGAGDETWRPGRLHE